MKYQVDISALGRWKKYDRFHAATDDEAMKVLIKMSKEQRGRQFQLVNLTTNLHMGYAVAPMKPKRKEARNTKVGL